MHRLSKLLLFLLTYSLLFYSKIAGQCPEKISISTDRDLYFTGETIWYKVCCLGSGTSKPSLLSKVAYFELYNINNNPVVQLKLYLTEGQLNSKLLLPDTLSTGTYFLKGYTNWMKNYGSQVFATKVISVINPFTSDVSAVINNLSSDIQGEVATENKNWLQVSQTKNEYKTRSLVDLSIKKSEDVKFLTVSVARLSLLNRRGNSALPVADKVNGINNIRDGLKHSPDHLPEPEGILISGTIRNKNNNNLLINEVITLNLVSSFPTLNISRTDNAGRFRFVVNQFGNKEMVIQPLNADTSGTGYLIELDPVFASDVRNISVNGSKFDDSDIDELNKCIINMQIEALYNSVLKNNTQTGQTFREYSFYSEPEIKVILDKYIELPTMNEVFKEIVPAVGIRDKKNVNSFKVFGTTGALKNYFAMVDGIPIKDINRIAAMNPEDIKQIEVINLTYYFKDQELGAIISIQTKKGDLSAMNFDNRIFRQEYTGYEYSYSFSSPDYSIDSIFSSPVADFRNVLYWNPDLKTDKEAGTLRFYTSDDTGTYLVSVEGIGPDGNKIRIEYPIKVVN